MIPILEACCREYVEWKRGRTYLATILEASGLVAVSQIDLVGWILIVWTTISRGNAWDSYSATAKDLEREEILEGAEQIRHAAVHQHDIEIKHLWNAMLLSEILGDMERDGEIVRVFDLVCAASTQQVSQNTVDALDNAFETARECTNQTQLFTGFETRMEKRLFFYTQQCHPNILRSRGWQVPEQGEMPRWEEIFRENHPAIQNEFPDDRDRLLVTCLGKARKLRNVVAHREIYDNNGAVLGHVHNSIRTLMVLGDYVAAIEVEIAAERWFTGGTRKEVFRSLRGVYLV